MTIVIVIMMSAAGTATVTACGSSQPPSPKPMTMAEWWNNVGSSEIQDVDQAGTALASAPAYSQDQIDAGTQLYSAAQGAFDESMPPADARDFRAWLNDSIQVAQLAEDGISGTVAISQQVIDGYQHIQAFYEVLATYGVGPDAADARDNSPQPEPDSPSATSVPVGSSGNPNSSPADTSVPSTPISTKPAFDCYINQDEQAGDQLYGASINIHPGTGTGYSQAVVKVTIFDKHGHVLQTKTVTATPDTSYTWQVVIYPDGDPSLSTESSCIAVVESAS